MHNLELQKSRKQIRRGEDKVSASRLGCTPCHASRLVGGLAKGVGVSSDIDEEASLDHILQYWYVIDVSIDIADNQCLTFGLGLTLEQDGPKSWLVFPALAGFLLPPV